MRVLIVGHSYIARFKKAAGPKVKNFVSLFGLDSLIVHGKYIPVSAVFIEGKGGLGLDNYTDREWLRRKVELYRPDLILLEDGTNECAGTPAPDVNLTYAKKCFEDVCDFFHDFMGVRFVIACEVIDRKRFRHYTVDHDLYGSRRSEWNKNIRAKERVCKRWFMAWKHDRSVFRSLTEGEIASDKIHPDSGFAWELHRVSMKSAIIVALKKIHGLQY